jgi:hypothetical protein
MNYHIYSSYHANFRNLPDWWVPISIARYAPFYYTGKRFLTLAPPKAIIKLKWDEFKPAYQEHLSKLDPVVVLKQLLELGGGKDIILLGYMKNREYDTRGLIANWLYESTGTLVIELETEDPLTGFTQMTLDF